MGTGGDMIVNLNDPQSISAWYRVNPKQHALFLRWALVRWPQFKAAIEASRGLI
jgi:hypothetical protein